MTTEWYMEMAAAMAKRDRAITMLNRWQKKLNEAEATIRQLATNSPDNPPEPVEQGQEQEQ